MDCFESVSVKMGEIITVVPSNSADSQLVYRVPEDTEIAFLLMDNPESSEVLIEKGDSVFGGKFLSFECPAGRCGIFLDLNTYIQRSGKNKGCIVLENSAGEFDIELFVLKK